MIGLANAGGDTINSIKQAAEFGITRSGKQKLAGLLVFITDVNALGLKTANGLVLTSAFYWDLNENTREWSQRFAQASNGEMPTMVHAGVYSAVLHYLKAVEAVGTDDSKVVLAKMKATATADPLFGRGKIREDGRKLHDMHLFKVKEPQESKRKWDYYKLIATIPAEEAFRSLGDPECSLVKASQ